MYLPFSSLLKHDEHCVYVLALLKTYHLLAAGFKQSVGVSINC